MKQIFSFFFLLAALSSQAQGAFLARPTKVFFNAAPALAQKQIIEVRNTDEVPLLLEFNLQDWMRDSLGNKLYANPGAYAQSCSRYIKLSAEKMLLQPGESRELELILTAPPEPLKQAMNAMLMVTQTAEKEADKAKGVSAQFVMQMRIGVHIYFQPTYLQERNIEFQRLFFAKGGSASKENTLATSNGLISELQNLGQTVEEGKVRLELNHETSGELLPLTTKVSIRCPATGFNCRLPCLQTCPRVNTWS
ncbi:hypothetical protein SAMN05444008_12357 [Cnuella takakiae]|uniref:P pilus assembly protein, chaperone PapD n=1 Tax=Cnuella takakiae TaxID=1302690 RepID=A0A1M5IFD1_9BACT|nr:hypothetical protein [Cnuella takakiae]OLY90823.1 hypothetical protein BUE76_02100 [Cnuella takakiae]SHG26799.1 hypothetical protein SAMN05444008_12357 [Cnuella takakiae]